MKKLSALAFTCLAMTAQAEFMDGNQLLVRLKSSGVEYLGGLGYIMGVADTLHGVTYCPPPNITSGQVADMVRNHLELLPDVRHLPGDAHVTHVIKRAWPCAEKRKGPGV